MSEVAVKTNSEDTKDKRDNSGGVREFFSLKGKFVVLFTFYTLCILLEFIYVHKLEESHSGLAIF